MNELRMQRGAAVCMAVTTLIVAALIPLNWGQATLLVAGWWVPASVGTVVAAAAALLVEAMRGSGRWIGPLALVLGAANVGGLVLYLIAWKGVAAPSTIGSPPVWSANTIVLPAIVLATVYRPRVPIVYAVGAILLLGTAQQYVKRGEFGYLGYLNGLMTASLVAVFIVMVYAVMDAVRAADARREQVLSASARAASRAARAAERERLGEVVRDHVVATLRAVTEGVPDDRHRAQAEVTLSALDGLGLDGVSTSRSTELTAAQAVLRLREAVNAFGDDTQIDVQVEDPDARYPYRLGEALVDASVEAIGNAVHHAGPEASRGVIGVFGSELVRIRIVDDGSGFDPLRVRPDCAGIELGIRRRMHAEPGGGAWVQSAVGEGTMVSLEWSRPR
ncbi:ATPase [Gordonia phthalatica]|uniref:ATPase n=1 Tax=Gordonia phthalatica TaxID=1136941 RepID=A0A0N9N5A0_9ACTN|nr:ATPase [Gordonia phthalatica]ALG85662.1 ATPase [Gordonia phthalatica]